MTKRNQTTEAQSRATGRIDTRQTGITEQDEAPAHSAELIAGLLAAADNGGSIEAQATYLADERLPTVQRQALASEIGQVQGNWHLRRALARLQANQETLRPDPLPVAQQPQASAVSPARVTDPSEGAETEAETAARAIVSGREVSVKPRADMVGTVARVPLSFLRHDWETVAQLLLRAQQEAISRRPRGSTPQPPDMTAVQTLEQIETLIRRIRADDNFPPRARNGANQVLRNIGILKATFTVRFLGGVGGAGMAGLLRELRTVAHPDRIYEDLGPEYHDWWEVWRRLVWRHIQRG